MTTVPRNSNVDKIESLSDDLKESTILFISCESTLEFIFKNQYCPHELKLLFIIP